MRRKLEKNPVPKIASSPARAKWSRVAMLTHRLVVPSAFFPVLLAEHTTTTRCFNRFALHGRSVFELITIYKSINEASMALLFPHT